MKTTRTRRQAVRRVRRRLDKAGLLERARKVLAAVQTPEFQRRLNAEVAGAKGDWVRDNHHVRQLVTRILDTMEVAHRDLDLTFAFDPATRKLDVWARPSMAAAAKIAAGAKLRAVGPGGAGG